MWNIPQEQFLALKCPRLPASTDRAISALAKTADDTVHLIGRLVEAKGRFARALARDLLEGRLRFPDFKSRPWPTSELWRHVSRVTRRNGSNLQLVLTASGEHGLVDQRHYFKRRVASVDLRSYYALRQGEFAYNRSAMLGYPFGATKRLDAYEAGALSTLYLCFAISDPCLDSDYLTHVFESGVLDRQLRRIARVGARAHGLLNVTDDDFFDLSIPLPEPDEQRRIAGVLKLIDREIQLLMSEKTHIAKKKSAVVHRLLAGELSGRS
jgi:type I restriction enzyme S subunit